MGAQLTKNDKRTCYVAELSAKDIGRHVCLMGWVQRQRDLGSLIFIDVRDRTGIVQLAFDSNTNKELFDLAFRTRSEYVVCAKGTVRPRGEGAVNKNLPTGEIEVEVDEYKVLSVSQTPPFEILENSDVRAELRLNYDEKYHRTLRDNEDSKRLLCAERFYRYRNAYAHQAYA